MSGHGRKRTLKESGIGDSGSGTDGPDRQRRETESNTGTPSVEKVDKQSGRQDVESVPPPARFLPVAGQQVPSKDGGGGIPGNLNFLQSALLQRLQNSVVPSPSSHIGAPRIFGGRDGGLSGLVGMPEGLARSSSFPPAPGMPASSGALPFGTLSRVAPVSAIPTESASVFQPSSAGGEGSGEQNGSGSSSRIEGKSDAASSTLNGKTGELASSNGNNGSRDTSSAGNNGSSDGGSNERQRRSGGESEESSDGVPTPNGAPAVAVPPSMSEMDKASDSLKEKKVPPFLSSLWTILEESEGANCIKWTRDGEAFVITSPTELSKTILPKHFKHSNFQSFIRQLNVYGFRKSSHDAYEFKHSNFLKGRPELLHQISRMGATTRRESTATAVRRMEHNARAIEELQAATDHCFATVELLRQEMRQRDVTLLALMNEIQSRNQQLASLQANIDQLSVELNGEVQQRWRLEQAVFGDPMQKR
uniref:HSF-type DNA-binding domain-containing protein n=1 Tax=Palpitomonas bilix TaxID=652834 RepID=A0A7S3GJB5_9EUKA|mmetsp:Transcript_5735/g.13429  ORF Transcript_5735/g.13429 Transcript_5735/m.13429 type:complete len:477 (+) Transcript_5735:335-1765(+)|eukprot:CAMPEP_0113916538 /NCGR_PEP_ID=MMETSP0780_2-20120614/32136_1 /TAXON_ID=652834 /ORGANISM="Palpitomonas bilix" /LENGTH=476 /DNA_ID=CAMNT_0000915815 /DNA_START=196 /DNA_END=1626 /DNA_ORIENTATION=- /assembly_acc=CAM_ASM_000599